MKKEIIELLKSLGFKSWKICTYRIGLNLQVYDITELDGKPSKISCRYDIYTKGHFSIVSDTASSLIPSLEKQLVEFGLPVEKMSKIERKTEDAVRYCEDVIRRVKDLPKHVKRPNVNFSDIKKYCGISNYSFRKVKKELIKRNLIIPEKSPNRIHTTYYYNLGEN